jgi:Zn-dependent protease
MDDYRRSPFEPYSSSGDIGKFSETEIEHLVVALGVLTLAFTFLFTDGVQGAIISPPTFILYLPLAFVAVLTAFLCHELGHKFLAQKYGYWAEFRYNIQYLLLGLVLAALVGLLIAAPGAVYIRGNPTTEENGKLSAAGPGINILVALAFVPVTIIFSSIDIIAAFAFVIAIVNLFIAGFNMIPGWIFDGAKIWAWNKVLYAGMWVAIIALGLFFYGVF